MKNRTINIKCRAVQVKACELDEYVDLNTIKACQNGCPNYENKWSCPPYSRDYISLRKDYENVVIICVFTDMDKYYDIKNKYLAMKAANVTLKTLIEKIARHLEEEWDGYSLLSGSCRLCKPCNCKIGLPCKRPSKMRYSMEAAHLDVNELVKDKLEHELLWYKDKKLPEYTTTVSLVLTNKSFEVEKLNKKFNDLMINLERNINK